MKSCSITFSITVGCLLALGCASAVPVHQSTNMGLKNEIVFSVEVDGDHTREVDGVEVLAILKSGQVQKVGEVKRGTVVLSKTALKEMETQVLLFCGDAYFCGAAPVFQPELNFYGFDEYHLPLAPFHIH